MIPSPGYTARSDVGNFGQVANWKFTELGNSCTTGHGSWFVSQTVKLLDDRSHSVAELLQLFTNPWRPPLRVCGATKWHFLSVRVPWRTAGRRAVMDLST